MKNKVLFFLLKVLILFLLFVPFFLAGYLCSIYNTFLPMGIYIGIMILFSFLMVPVALKRIHNEMKKQENMTEEEIQADINEDGSKLKYDAYQIKAVVENWKLSSKSDKIKGILFVSFFITCCVGFVVLMVLGYMIYAFICFGAGAGLIIISLIVVKLLERRSLHMKDGGNYTREKAIVLSSTLSSQTTTGTRHRKHIKNTTYKVRLRISSDETLTTYSKEDYEIGDQVIIYRETKNSKVVHIIKKLEDVFDEDEF